MKLELRAAKRRSAANGAPPSKPHARPRAVLVAVELNDSSAAAATVAAAGLLADALGAEVILAGIAPLVQAVPPDAPATSLLTRTADCLPAGVVRRTMLRWGATGPAIVEAARQEQVDLVVVSTHSGADHYVVHHTEVPVLVVPAEHPGDAAA